MRRRAAGTMIYTLTIKTEPYARVDVSGITKESDYAGYAVFKLKKGSYYYSIGKSGYYGEFEVFVIDCDITIEVFLEEIDYATRLLLPFDGDVCDYSVYGNDLTNNGMDYTDGIFRQALQLRGTSSQIDMSPALPAELLFSDFTIDFRIKINDTSNETIFLYLYGFIRLECYDDTIRILTSSVGDYPWDIVRVFTANYKHVFNHIALVRNGNTLYLYVNGLLVGNIPFDYTQKIAESNCCLGGFNSYYNESTNVIDEFRFSTVARWTSNFTPPTQPYKKLDTYDIHKQRSGHSLHLLRRGAG